MKSGERNYLAGMIFALAFSFAQVEESRQHPFDDVIKDRQPRLNAMERMLPAVVRPMPCHYKPNLIKRRRDQFFNCGERHHPSRPVVEHHGQQVLLLSRAPKRSARAVARPWQQFSRFSVLPTSPTSAPPSPGWPLCSCPPATPACWCSAWAR